MAFLLIEGQSSSAWWSFLLWGGVTSAFLLWLLLASSSWFSFSISDISVLHLLCSSREVLDLRNQSNLNCGAFLTQLRSSSYTFSLSSPSLLSMHTRNLSSSSV